MFESVNKSGAPVGLVRKVLFFALLATLLGNATAQDLKVEATVSETTIGTEETVTLTIEVSGRSLPDIPTPNPPQSEGLVLANQFPFTSQNMSIVNGRVTQSVGFTWTYRPVREGTARFSPVNVEIEGKTYSTRGITIKVVPQAQRPPRVQRRNPFLFDPFAQPSPSQEPDPEITDRDMFIRATPSKRRVYQNEQLTIEYELFFRSGIQLRQSRLADSWDAEGFWREELEIESRPIPKSVVVNGLRYNSIVLKKVAVFPTRTGTLEIDPLRIESEAALPFRANDPFFSLRNRYQPVRLGSPAVSIEVLPWPDNPPTSFGGAVGTFEVAAATDRTALDVGESLQMTVRISGAGNVATLDAPSFRPPGVFEVYDPEVNTQISRAGQTVRGTKTFTYILVPRANGSFELPAVEFTFLDPSAGSYRTVRSESMPLTVSGTAGPVPDVTATASGLPVDDIAGLKTTGLDWVRTDRKPLHRRLILYFVALLPLLSIAGLALWRSYADRLARDVPYARSRRAHPLARKHLKRADDFMQDDDGRAFYEELERAVLGFVGNRLNVSEIGMTRVQLQSRLQQAGVDEDILASLTKLLDECDRARFAPVRPSGEAMAAALDRASELIVELNNAFSSSTLVAA